MTRSGEDARLDDFAADGAGDAAESAETDADAAETAAGEADAIEDAGNGSARDSAGNGGGAGDAGDADPVEVGVELLSKLEFESLSMAEVLDRLETVTTHPRTTRRILETAEERGVIERDGSRVHPQGGGYVSFESEVIEKEGDFTCKRCGTGISTGYFINLDAGELGPFGSSCIRKVTGRE